MKRLLYIIFTLFAFNAAAQCPSGPLPAVGGPKDKWHVKYYLTSDSIMVVPQDTLKSTCWPMNGAIAFKAGQFWGYKSNTWSTLIPGGGGVTQQALDDTAAAIRSSISGSGVTSFNTRTGAVVPASGDYTTTLVPEGTNLYWTNARFDTRFASSISGYYTSTQTDNLLALKLSIASAAATYFKITDTTGKWQYNLGFLPYTQTQVNTIANLRLLISDTTNMLAPYLRKNDTSNMLSGYQRKGDSATWSTRYRNDTGNANIRAQIAALPSADSSIFQTKYRSDTGRTNIYTYAGTKVNYGDTAAMLNPYLHKSDSIAAYFTKYRSDTMRSNIYTYIGGANALNMKYTDTAAMLTNYLHKSDSANGYATKYRLDTTRTALYAYIITSDGLNVKYTDTAAMLLNYLHKSDSIAGYFTKYRSDTMRTDFLAYIATKMSYTDSAAMLAYYMRKNDSGIYYSKYRSDTERVNNLAYFVLKAPLASPTFTGTPTAPTPAAGTNTGAIATASFVTSALVAYTTQTVTTTSYTTSVTPTSTVASPMSSVIYTITAQAGALLFNNPSGSWADGQQLIFRVKDNGTARALTYGTNYADGIAPSAVQPTTTTITRWTNYYYLYNSSATHNFQFMGVQITAD